MSLLDLEQEQEQEQYYWEVLSWGVFLYFGWVSGRAIVVDYVVRSHLNPCVTHGGMPIGKAVQRMVLRADLDPHLLPPLLIDGKEVVLKETSYADVGL